MTLSENILKNTVMTLKNLLNGRIDLIVHEQLINVKMLLMLDSMPLSNITSLFTNIAVTCFHYPQPPHALKQYNAGYNTIIFMICALPFSTRATIILCMSRLLPYSNVQTLIGMLPLQKIISAKMIPQKEQYVCVLNDCYMPVLKQYRSSWTNPMKKSVR